jgi:integrase
MAKRRSNQEGSIYKRNNDTWCAQVTVNGRRLTKYAKTQRECREWVQKTIEQVSNGLTFGGASTTVKKYMEEWLKTIKPSLRPKTWAQYEQVSRMHIVPIIGRLKLKDVRPDHVQSLYTKKMEEGKSPTTVRIIHAVLHRAFVQAVKWGLLGRNPVDAVNKPKPRRVEMKVLSDDQVRSLLSMVEGTKYAALYHLAVTTGLRQGELLGLRWSDLDWVSRQLRVQRQLQRVTGQGLVFKEPKSSAGRRVVVLGSTTIDKLREHLILQREQRLFAGKRWQENDLIFPSTIGTPMGPRNLMRHFKSILNAAGLPDIRFHDLRHTAATLMLQQGIHPKVVQERLGHSAISLTLDTYSHVLPSMQEEAAKAMDELLTPIPVKL